MCLSVILFMGGEGSGERDVSLAPCPFWRWVSLVPGPFWGRYVQGGWVCPGVGMFGLGGLSPGGGYVWEVGTPWTWTIEVGTTHPRYWHLVVATTCTIGKRPVHVLLECIFVLSCCQQELSEHIVKGKIAKTVSLCC